MKKLMILALVAIAIPLLAHDCCHDPAYYKNPIYRDDPMWPAYCGTFNSPVGEPDDEPASRPAVEIEPEDNWYRCRSGWCVDPGAR